MNSSGVSNNLKEDLRGHKKRVGLTRKERNRVETVDFKYLSREMKSK